MTHARRTGEDRVLTVPNALTALRLALLPVFVVLLSQPHGRQRAAAACLLAGLGITDGVDGYVARHFHQVSALGRIADPLVDRALVLSAVGGAVVVGAVPVWFIALVALREAVVLGGSIAMALAGVRRLDVSWAGKAGAFGMMVALPLFILGHAPFRGHAEAEALAWVAAVPGQVFSWAAAGGYVPKARAALSENRQSRRGGAGAGETIESPSARRPL